MHRYRRKYNRFNNHIKQTSWEKKKFYANHGDFALARLLVGEKAVLIIKSLLKLTLIVGILSVILVAFNQKYWLVPTVILSVTFLCFVILIILSILGEIYNHLGNIVNELRKTFRK